MTSVTSASELELLRRGAVDVIEEDELARRIETRRLTVKVGGEDDGAVVVPARLVAEIVRSLPVGAVEVGLVGEELSISAGRSQFVIRPLSLDDYPVQAEPATEAVTLPLSALCMCEMKR